MATAKIVLFKSKKLADGTSPVMIRLSEYSKKAFIRIGNYSATPEQWNAELNCFRANVKSFEKKNKFLQKTKDDIKIILSELLASQDFSFDAFKKKYFKANKQLSVKEAYNKKIGELGANDQVGTSLSYTASLLAVITDFNKGLDIPFAAITTDFLKKFQAYNKEKSGNTISHYLRPLRALYNEYLEDNGLPSNLSPFTGQRGFKIKKLETKTRKKSLTIEQLQAIIDIETIEGTYKHFSKTMFLFSFYTRGMNLMDISQLKKSDIFNGKIAYQRAKTHGLLIIGIIPQVEALLSQFNEPKYIFPILNQSGEMTALELKKRVKGANRNINRKLNEMGNIIGIDGLSFGWARHTWANLAKQKGYSVEEISEGMDHSDIRTTNIYLSTLGSDRIDNITKNLIN